MEPTSTWRSCANDIAAISSRRDRTLRVESGAFIFLRRVVQYDNVKQYYSNFNDLHEHEIVQATESCDSLGAF